MGLTHKVERKDWRSQRNAGQEHEAPGGKRNESRLHPHILDCTAQTFTLVIGYWLWASVSRARGSRLALLSATLGLSIYPALVATTLQVEVIVLLAALSGIFQAGLNLVFFDELMKTVPPDQTALFVSIAQSMEYMSAIAAPLIGTFLADYIGLGGALLASAALRVLAFLLFVRGNSVQVAIQA